MTQCWTRKIYGEKAKLSVDHFIKKIYANNYWFDDAKQIIYLYHTINDVNTKIVKLIVAKNFNGFENTIEYENLKKIVAERIQKKENRYAC